MSWVTPFGAGWGVVAAPRGSTHSTVKPTPPANEDGCRQCGDEEGVEERFMEGGRVPWITSFFEGGAGCEGEGSLTRVHKVASLVIQHASWQLQNGSTTGTLA